MGQKITQICEKKGEGEGSCKWEKVDKDGNLIDYASIKVVVDSNGHIASEKIEATSDEARRAVKKLALDEFGKKSIIK